MAVVSVNPYASWVSHADASGEREYVAEYIVETNSRQTGPIEVRDFAGIPRVNDHYVWYSDFDLGAFAYKFSTRFTDDTKLVQIVTVYYSSSWHRRNQDYQDDPVDQNAIISGGGQMMQKVATKDREGTPIQTTAGEPIVDVYVDDARPLLRIQKNFNTIDLDQLNDFTNAVNSATFFGLDAGFWKMDAPEWEQRFRGAENPPFYTITFRFQAPGNNQDEDWRLRIIDRGSYYKDGNVKKAFKVDGIKVPKGLLNGFDGGEQPEGLDPALIDPVKYYKERDFALLGIPTSL